MKIDNIQHKQIANIQIFQKEIAYKQLVYIYTNTYNTYLNGIRNVYTPILAILITFRRSQRNSNHFILAVKNLTFNNK